MAAGRGGSDNDSVDPEQTESLTDDTGSEDTSTDPNTGGRGNSTSTINLSTLTANYIAQNGYTLTGRLNAKVKISIADGATVTLRDVTINGENSSSYPWAGLNCEGCATIILEGRNSIKGFDGDYPGIHGTTGHTLTIKGDGKLNARSNGWGAGIGGGYGIDCGNIVIDGGTITSTGGQYGAGIGSGYEGNCGNITISGGNITANGGYEAAGIGSGLNGSCENITITDVKLTATKGQYSPNTIGAGLDGSCGTVSVGFVEGAISESPYPYPGLKVTDLSTISADYTAQFGEVLTGTLGANVNISIADGATVILRDATINGVNDPKYLWAGLTCSGDATIMLKGRNSVKGFQDSYPGISVLPDKTLTITGTGSLDTSSNGWGAGIGGGSRISCGNIMIEGGTITATGGRSAAGIGGGLESSCGNITITTGTVTAEKGKNAPYSIGAGNKGTCGKVIVGFTEGAISESPFPYQCSKITDLSTIKAAYIAHDREILTGTLGAKVKVSIADGATVTIRDVTINGVNWAICPWAGLTCKGDATIIIEGTNFVKGFHLNYPGIHVPEGKTLTIKGDGSLDASSTGCGAGIGGGQNIPCGNIVIEGGTIIATGGWATTGIGGGNYSNCGNIVIEGGTITANGGHYAGGIGCGLYSKCGTITIKDTVTKVTATKGNDAPYSVGAGDDGTCGTITIGGQVRDKIEDNPFIYPPEK